MHNEILAVAMGDEGDAYLDASSGFTVVGRHCSTDLEREASGVRDIHGYSRRYRAYDDPRARGSVFDCCIESISANVIPVSEIGGRTSVY